MKFINQAMKDKFEHCVKENKNDKYGNDINTFVVDYADLMEEKFFASDMPLEEWMQKYAISLSFQVPNVENYSGFQVDCAKQVLQDIWIFRDAFTDSLIRWKQQMREGI